MKSANFFRFDLFFWRSVPSLTGWLASSWWKAYSIAQSRLAAYWRFTVTMTSLMALAAVGVFDFFIRPEISTLYLFPILFAAWFGGRNSGLLIGSSAALTWLAANLLSGALYLYPVDIYSSALVRLVLFVAIALLVARVRVLTDALENRIEERTGSLVAEVTRRQEVEREIAEISRQEQERLAHELHDHLGASLAGTAFRAQALAEILERRGAPESHDARQLAELINATSRQARNLARLLDPAEDTERNLSSDLSQLAREMETLFEISCPVQLSGGEPPLNGEQKHQLHRIALEATRNAVQHGKARLVEIFLRYEPGELTLEVRNDGNPWNPSPQPLKGLGLRIMRYRTGTLGGTLAIKRGPDGRTAIICKAPINNQQPFQTHEPSNWNLKTAISRVHEQEQGSGVCRR
jgi:signal transduction histidine kinase